MTEAARSTDRVCSLLAAAALLAGCTTVADRPPPGAPSDRADAVVECQQFYATVDAAVSDAGVRDAQTALVPGRPHLRINRFLAAGATPEPGVAFEAWVDRLHELDRVARGLEIRNLPSGPPAAWQASLDRCGRILRARDRAQSGLPDTLQHVRVPDAYRTGLRVIGLYPLAALPFLAGVANLHRETAATFATPLNALPVKGSLHRYSPPAGPTLDADRAAAILARSATNPLTIPDPDPGDLRRLFLAFAPIWEIDTATSADLPGQPVLEAGGAVVRGAPTVYTLRSFSRWQGRSLLQLNYVLWFPARPRRGPLDLVGGHLDGITWRVTLGTDGQPLIYDAMHNCGCYYQAFPTPRLVAAPAPGGLREPMAVPQTVADGDGRVVIRIASGSHYLQRVYRHDATPATASYAFEDYDRLRSLPRPGGGYRSLFDQNGIVPGTERRERWLFWPMGVPEPGAMRQWGTHAIAFVGRRHFDDPDLHERFFVPAE